MLISREGLGGPRADSFCKDAIAGSLVGCYYQVEHVSISIRGWLIGSVLTAVVSLLGLVGIPCSYLGGVNVMTVMNVVAAGASGRRAAVGV